MKTNPSLKGRALRPKPRKPVSAISVSNEVWIATALLHRDQPNRQDFSIDEILERVRKEKITSQLRPSAYAHIVQHCVANKPPSPSRLRYLVETRPGFRKLFRNGYGWHFYRDKGRILPAADSLPQKYRRLLEWYRDSYNVSNAESAKKDSILELCGLGKEIWEGIDPDEYVRQLREGWE